jgi:hypothetical protein
MMRAAAFVFALLLIAPEAARAQRAERSVVDVSAGFGSGAGGEGNLKLGQWTPIQVRIEVKNGEFRGEVHVTTADTEGNDVTIVIPNIAIPESINTTTTPVYGLVKFGRQELAVDVKLVDTSDPASPRVVEQRQWKLNDDNRHANIVEANEPLIVYGGSAAGLYEVKEFLHKQSEARLGSFNEGLPSMARFRGERDFPTQWYGYGGVDAVVLMTGDWQFIDRLDPLRTHALQTWVRSGGHLIVSVAKSWQNVDKSFLGPMLPVKLVGADEVQLAKSPIHEKLESFSGGSNNPFDVKRFGTIQLAQFGKLRGEPMPNLTHADRPLAVVGPYGLGRVTVLAFDADDTPFKDWKGATQFWISLSKFKAPAQQAQQYYRAATSDDLSRQVNAQLENFPDVTVVPFGWVALLIFLYILLIGPVDYFFLKKVVKRLELTWITFPTWVIVISVAAYYSAYLLKGDDLRLNRLEIVDVDAASGTLRGNAFLGVFSPQIARYDVAYTPSLASGGKWSELPAGNDASTGGGLMGDDQTISVSSWQGIPDQTFRGLGSTGSSNLLGRRSFGYKFYDGGSILGVAGAPIQVWSVKTFTGQWLAKAAPVVDAKLKGRGALLTGTITNLTKSPLEGVLLAYYDNAYTIAKIEPNATIDIAAVTRRDLRSLVAENFRTNGYVGGDPNRILAVSDIEGVVRSMLFGKRHNTNNQAGGNYYLSHLDLSSQLELGRAILLARVDGDPNVEGGELWLNDAPGPGAVRKPLASKTKKNTFLRVFLQPSKENE